MDNQNQVGLTKEQVEEVVSSILSSQKQEPQAQPFIFGNTQFESREAAEQAIAQYVAQEKKRTEELQAKVEQLSKQQAATTVPAQTDVPQFDKSKWADQLVEDPRVGVSKALGWAIGGRDIDAAQLLRETVAAVIQQRQTIEEMRTTINEWQQRASNPHVPWDNTEVRGKIEAAMKQFNLPPNRDGYDMAVGWLERKNEIPKRDQWMAQLQQQGQSGQPRQTNVQQMRPMGLPSVGPSNAQTPQGFDDSIFDTMTDEQLEKLRAELVAKEQHSRRAV